MIVHGRENPIDELKNRISDAFAVKAQYDATLSEIAKYILPAAQDMVSTIPVNQGQIRTVNIYTAVPALAAQRMGAGVFAYLMPTGQHWFTLRATPEEMNEQTDIKMWLSDFRVAVHQALWDSNYQREMYTCIQNLCIFGTACISVMWDDGLVFENHHLRDIAFELNNRGIVDTVFKKKYMTVRQAVQQFGDISMGKEFDKERATKPYSHKKFEFVHCVYPNDSFDRTKMGSFPFVSRWLNMADRKIVKEGGYYEQPYIVVRFSTIPGEDYGRSPSHFLLPEIKMYDRMRRIFIESSERAQNPPWWIASESVIGQPMTSPGAVMYGTPMAQPPVPLNTGVNSQLNAQMLEQLEGIIERGYYNDLFDVLAHYRNMTATEVEARMEEKMVLLSPAINGQKGELTDPVIERSAKLLMRHGRLAPRPMNLETEIIYTGRLAMAMSTMQSNALGTVMAKWAPYAEMHPVYDNVKMDEAFKHDARAHGVPERLLVDDREVAIVRQQREQMNTAQQGSEIMESASKAYKNIYDAGGVGDLIGAL